jgi:outer membrane protein OmpA-like peptidoglycan-associated protein
MLARGIAIALLLSASAAAVPTRAEAQVLDRMRRAAGRALEGEAARQVARLLRNAVRCVFDDQACIDRAKADGKEVVLTKDDGEVLMDAEGKPITDPSAVPQQEPEKPGTGAWANYDFVPGENVLFFEDFANDNVGDFPRRMTLIRGNWEIVEWQGRRLLRNTGPRHSALQIILPDTLPERFTIELEAHLPHVNYQFIVSTAAPPNNGNHASLTQNFFQVGVAHGTGVAARASGPVEALSQTDIMEERLMPVRIMVDGKYAKVFVAERRVANVPNAELPRTDRVYIENTYAASEENPILIGSIRIAAGGRDLYDVLAAEGRVATQGILFATGSARIRPESTPTLKEIGTMLQQHADLRIAIEGHTDDVGDDASNQTLSEQRAAAVKAYLVESFGIDQARLQSAGFGESRPAVPNDSPEARQQNRRVELVRLGT